MCTAAEEGRHQEGAGAETETGWNLNGSAATAPPVASWIHLGFELTQTSVCSGSANQADRTKLSHRQGGAQGKMVRVYKLVVCNELWDYWESNVNCAEYLGFPIKTWNVFTCAFMSFIVFFKPILIHNIQRLLSRHDRAVAASQTSFNSSSWEIRLCFNGSKGQSGCEVLLDVWERLIFGFSLFGG